MVSGEQKVEWYLHEGSQRIGPVCDEALRVMAASRRLAPGTLLWCEGMTAAAAASNIEGLFAPEVSPALAPVWRRYWARMCDILIAVVVVIFIAALLRPSFFDEGGAFAGETGDRVLGILALPLALLLDAAFYWSFGNTPGKAMAGIRTVREDGERLSLSQTVNRNLGLWVHGLGLGIPLISLFTLAKSHRKGRTGAPCRWEESSGARSYSDTDSRVRTVMVALVFLGLCGALLWLGTAAD
jgi:uncharacterized RDD family membrane protein YckC